MLQWSIGIDLAEIHRFREYPFLEHSRFYERVFDEYEIKYCTDHFDPYPHFTGIFAAKEAVFKAVNKFKPLNFSQISIRHDENGRPIVQLENDDISPPMVDKRLRNSENLVVQVSITHSTDLALAWALVCVKNSQNNRLEGLNRLKVNLEWEIYNEFVEYQCTS